MDAGPLNHERRYSESGGNMLALEVENLTVVLGSAPVVEDVSLIIDEGEMVALIGPNGAGKSTLVKAVLGLVPIYSGVVRIFGQPLAALGTEREHIGYVPQRLEIDRTIPVTVVELMGINTPARLFTRKRAEAALAEVDATRLLNQRIGELSGGELQ